MDSPSRNLWPARFQLSEAWSAFCLFLPLILLGCVSLFPSLPNVIVHGDLALIERSTLLATRFEQLLGPYSRFKMHHPGPALFYWLAPWYELGRHSFGSLCIGMLFLNSAAFLMLALVPWRLCRGAFLAATPALLLLFLHTGPQLFWASWNPDAGVLPLAASVACAFAVASGRPGFLPAGIFLGALASQCHVLYVLPTASAWLVAAALLVFRRPAPRLLRRSLLLAAFLFALCQFPVMLEQLRGDPGNLSVILHLKNATAGESLGSAAWESGAAAISESLWAPFGYQGGRRLEGEAALWSSRFSWAALPLLFLFFAIAWWRGATPALPAFACLAAWLGSSGWALASLTGELHAYLTRFLVPTLPLAATMIATVASGSSPSPKVAARPGWWLATSAVLSLLACRQVLSSPSLATHLDQNWGQAAYGRATTRILDALDQSEIHFPYLGILDPELWPYAAALVNQIEKRGGHAVVYEDWEFMFGPASLAGPHDGLLLIGSSEVEASNEALSAKAVEIAEPPVRATLLPLPAAFSQAGRHCIAAGDEEFDLFFRTGFYPPEFETGSPPFFWSSGDHSVASVRLLPGRAYRISFEATPYEYTQPQAMRLAVDGQDLASFELDSGWRRYEALLPAARVQPVNEVILYYRNTAVPQQIGRSNDHRALGARIRSLCFEEQSN